MSSTEQNHCDDSRKDPDSSVDRGVVRSQRGRGLLERGRMASLSLLSGVCVASTACCFSVLPTDQKGCHRPCPLIMERYKKLEEDLREAACNGDTETVLEILSKGVNVDARNLINGWTALHWAAKRGRKEVVEILLDHGADSSVLTEKGESPLSLALGPEVRALLSSAAAPGGCQPPASSPASLEMNGTAESSALPILPSYINKMPPLGHHHHAKDFSAHSASNGALSRRSHQTEPLDELVLKVRVANGGDPDFIEIELPRTELTYYTLLRVCCEELGLNASQVIRIRKLPNTMLRKDKDVQRLQMMEELEVVVTASSAKHQPNGYKSIQLYKNQTILY